MIMNHQDKIMDTRAGRRYWRMLYIKLEGKKL